MRSPAFVMLAVVLQLPLVLSFQPQPTTLRTRGALAVSMCAAEGKQHRRAAIQSMATPLIAAALVAVGPGTALEASAEPFDDVKAARRVLDKMDAMIDAEQWDKIRTLLNNPPLAFTGPGSIGAAMKAAGATLPKGMRGAAKGIGEDFLTNTRLLDTFVYSNVFVDEGRVNTM
ncbi:hypothetical protein T484DRAFT_3531105 [Baffinella frigidus]|nr:hypothetical protein T484DRAFT_3531105 [Cryptophyta sp. CCMP2293]